jgi:hypothetical protein
VKHRLPPVFWVESSLACITALLAFLTFLLPDWIELVFAVDPDRHSGSIEWKLVLMFVTVAALFAALARREKSRASLALSAENGLRSGRSEEC